MSKTTNSTPKKGRYTDSEIIAALKASGGMVYLAAKSLGCDPVTIYNRREKSAAVREAIENARGEMLDFAETALKSAVVAKEAWAVCFTLKTIGKHRGYVERVEQTGANGGAIQHNVLNTSAVDLADKTEAELDAYGAKLAKLWTS